MYQKRMLNYYPPVIQSVQEFRAIIDSESPEIKALADGGEAVLNDAYLPHMSDDRVLEWENALGIIPLKDSTFGDRRDTIIARLRSQGKLNTATINAIVSAFTEGTANSYIQDGVLYVDITPPPNNKVYKFDNVERELAKKVPAHLGLVVRRNYATWGDVARQYSSWNAVKQLSNWEELVNWVDSD